MVGLDQIQFTLPQHTEEDWYSVEDDNVVCTSDEEDNAKLAQNMFLKAAKRKPQDNKTSVKRAGPQPNQGQGQTYKHTMLG